MVAGEDCPMSPHMQMTTFPLLIPPFQPRPEASEGPVEGEML